MNKKYFKIGERVKYDFLGAGEVKKIFKGALINRPVAYLVLFDKAPPVRYNMGQNPTLQFCDELSKE